MVRELYAAEGYQFAEIQPEIKNVEGGTKLVHVTFHVTEGPKVKIDEIDFVGNKALSDGKLGKKMKENKQKGFFGFITGGGTYKEDKFAEDAQLITDFYRDEGYIMAQVGQPQMKTLEDSKDGKTRWIQLQVPITEGKKYAVGDFKFEGNKVVNSEALRPLFKVETGEIYSQKKVKKGLEKAQEVYGSGGYFEFTAYPDLQPRDQPKPAEAADGAAGPPSPGPPSPAAGSPASPAQLTSKDGTPLVDVTMRVDEGKQYFINRITFTGNTTTRDNVIRRELRIVEAAPFNTMALKDSVKRLNQLGYFKPLEGEAVDVKKTADADNKVDIGLKFEEQNRNQLTFGAGVSQFDGFFGQLSFQTSNFMGRGETFSVTAQQGNRAKNYQVAFTEPFLFDRPMTAGIDVFSREIRYEGQFTQASVGGNLVFGFQVMPYARMFMNYSLEQVEVKDLNPLYNDPLVLAGNPFLYDSLLIGEGGKRTISKIAPSFVYNTVDHPIFPTSGKRYTLSFDWAGFGGNTNFLNPRAEGIWYFPLGARAPDVAGLPRAGRVHQAVWQHGRAADFREAVSRRRVQHARVRPAHGRAARSAHGARRGRQQEPPRQRGVPDQHHGSRPAGPVLRRGSGARPGPELLVEGTDDAAHLSRRAHPGSWGFLSDTVQPVCIRLRSADQRDRRHERVQDVDRRRDPVLHAGAERAVPFDLCRQPVARRRAGQQPAAREEVEIPVRRGVDVLDRCQPPASSSPAR